MIARTLISIFIIILAILLIGSCATNPKTREEWEGLLKWERFLAVKRGDITEVKRLIDEGADVNAQGKDGWTALMFASREVPHSSGIQYKKLKPVNTEVVQLLIEAGADVNAQGKDGWTALMIASIHKQPEVAQLLIRAGADVNARNKDGRTALMIASIHKQPEVAQLLIRAGADVNARDRRGLTALWWASREFYQRHVKPNPVNPELVQLLINAGAK